MKVSVGSNMDAIQRHLEAVAKQSKFATMQALNDAAYAVRADVQGAMRSTFQGVTPYMVRSIWVRTATKQQLRASVWPRYMGGKGFDPEHILMPHVFGGDRKVKASERALQRIGVLPAGMSIAPGRDCPLDAYGNPDRGAIVQMLSYFKAFGEQGYKANITDDEKAKLNTRGVRYFVSYGKGRSSHLAPGIWMQLGHKKDAMLFRMFMFVKKVSYSKRLDYFGVADAAVRRTFEPAYARRMSAAMRTAR